MLESKVGVSGGMQGTYTNNISLEVLDCLSVEMLSPATTRLDVLATRLAFTGQNMFFICENTSQQKSASEGSSLAEATFQPGCLR
jgi:hypothetical protein